MERFVHRARQALHLALKTFGSRDEWKWRSGIYLCVADRKTGLPYLLIPIGKVPVGKAERYAHLALEKALRLANHSVHKSSWESRNPDSDKWGGAIRAGAFIISISGLPELGDEAVALQVVWPQDEPVQEIAAKSGNPYWKQLSEVVEEERSYEEHSGT